MVARQYSTSPTSSPPDYRESPNSSTALAPRQKMLTTLITRMYLTCSPGQLPDQQGLMALVVAWDQALETIPDSHLIECFRRGFELHSAGDQRTFPMPATVVLHAWQELRTERAAYAYAQPQPVAGYLPSGEPEPYYNIGPLVAELKVWAKRLGWWQDAPPDPEMPQQLADPKMALLLRYAVAIRRFYQQSPADCAEFVREMATALVAENPQIDFDFVLLEVHGFDELPPVAVARECKVCRGMKHVALVDRSLERAPSAIGTMPCPKCGGR
jgi:hypothetical protein